MEGAVFFSANFINKGAHKECRHVCLYIYLIMTTIISGLRLFCQKKFLAHCTRTRLYLKVYILHTVNFIIK